MLFRAEVTAVVDSLSGGLDIVVLAGVPGRLPASAADALLANIVLVSAVPKDNDALGNVAASPGLSALGESAAEDVAVEGGDEEN